MSSKHTSPISLSTSNALKGIAILMVLLIHTLSSIQPSVFLGFDGTYLPLAVFLDQLSRLSVPLFVAISGMGLSLKYRSRDVRLAETPQYLFHRLKKLLPKYLVWSIILILAVKLVPIWRSQRPSPPLGLLLLLGYADYHLYFVPMILQLYVLFPLLHYFYKRWPVGLLAVSLIVQMWWWQQFSYQNRAPFSISLFAEDREQYLWFVNWVWYFVLGFALPNLISWCKKQSFRSLTLIFAGCATYVWVSMNALTRIKQGVDPLLALRFTQYPVLMWASVGIVMLCVLFSYSKALPRGLMWLGEKSYDIYLSHTLALRIIFTALLML